MLAMIKTTSESFCNSGSRSVHKVRWFMDASLSISIQLSVKWFGLYRSLKNWWIICLQEKQFYDIAENADVQLLIDQNTYCLLFVEYIDEYSVLYFWSFQRWYYLQAFAIHYVICWESKYMEEVGFFRVYCCPRILARIRIKSFSIILSI